jgi:hypothetical protein
MARAVSFSLGMGESPNNRIRDILAAQRAFNPANS